jgi:hypothetical protein
MSDTSRKWTRNPGVLLVIVSVKTLSKRRMLRKALEPHPISNCERPLEPSQAEPTCPLPPYCVMTTAQVTAVLRFSGSQALCLLLLSHFRGPRKGLAVSTVSPSPCSSILCFKSCFYFGPVYFYRTLLSAHGSRLLVRPIVSPRLTPAAWAWPQGETSLATFISFSASLFSFLLAPYYE